MSDPNDKLEEELGKALAKEDPDIKRAADKANKALEDKDGS